MIFKLKKFSRRITTFYEACEDFKIVFFEEQTNTKLPEDYKSFLKTTNGFCLMSTSICGIKNKEKEDLLYLYKREHFEVNNPMPSYLIPFSPDGQGGFYCFDTSSLNKYSCNIVFWDSYYSYTENDAPEIVNASFEDWVEEVVIEWTIDEHEERELFD